MTKDKTNPNPTISQAQKKLSIKGGIMKDYKKKVIVSISADVKLMEEVEFKKLSNKRYDEFVDIYYDLLATWENEDREEYEKKHPED